MCENHIAFSDPTTAARVFPWIIKRWNTREVCARSAYCRSWLTGQKRPRDLSQRSVSWSKTWNWQSSHNSSRHAINRRPSADFRTAASRCRSTTERRSIEAFRYCKSRIFRTHSIFVAWALRPFVRMKFSYSRWPLQILWDALYLSHAFYFRTEGGAYEIYENNMHTKYSGFTVRVFSRPPARFLPQEDQ